MSPYVSDAQRKKFHALLTDGKISQKVVDEFDEASKGKDLPEHVGDQPDKMHKSGFQKRAVKKGKHFSMVSTVDHSKIKQTFGMK